MAKVEIYTWQSCPFCIKAKSLLESKGVNYEEHKIDGDQEGRIAMMARADGRSSVPQIFINDVGIGVCDELHALENSKQLDALLVLVD